MVSGKLAPQPPVSICLVQSGIADDPAHSVYKPLRLENNVLATGAICTETVRTSYLHTI